MSTPARSKNTRRKNEEKGGEAGEKKEKILSYDKKDRSRSPEKKKTKNNNKDECNRVSYYNTINDGKMNNGIINHDGVYKQAIDTHDMYEAGGREKEEGEGEGGREGRQGEEGREGEEEGRGGRRGEGEGEEEGREERQERQGRKKREGREEKEGREGKGGGGEEKREGEEEGRGEGEGEEEEGGEINFSGTFRRSLSFSRDSDSSLCGDMRSAEEEEEKEEIEEKKEKEEQKVSEETEIQKSNKEEEYEKEKDEKRKKINNMLFNRIEGEDVDWAYIDGEDVSFILGKGGHTKRKINRVSGASIFIKECEGRKTRLEIKGKEENREKARLYIKYVMLQRIGSILLDSDPLARNDLTIMRIPEECVGYVTGSGGRGLRVLEEEWGVLTFFSEMRMPSEFEKNPQEEKENQTKEKNLEKKENKEKEEKEGSKKMQRKGGRKKGEKFAIFGDERARGGAQLKVMSIVEQKLPGYYSAHDPSDYKSEEEGFDTETLSINAEDFSYALGREGNTRRKIARASGAVIEYIGNIAYIAGTRPQRERAREYLRWLCAQRNSYAQVDTTGRTDCTVLKIPTYVAEKITATGGKFFRKIEKMTNTFIFPDGDLKSGKSTERILIFGENEDNRRRAKGLLGTRLLDTPPFNRNAATYAKTSYRRGIAGSDEQNRGGGGGGGMCENEGSAMWYDRYSRQSHPYKKYNNHNSEVLHSSYSSHYTRSPHGTRLPPPVQQDSSSVRPPYVQYRPSYTATTTHETPPPHRKEKNQRLLYSDRGLIPNTRMYSDGRKRSRSRDRHEFTLNRNRPTDRERGRGGDGGRGIIAREERGENFIRGGVNGGRTERSSRRRSSSPQPRVHTKTYRGEERERQRGGREMRYGHPHRHPHETNISRHY